MVDKSQSFGIRPGAEEFPLQIVISTIYPCNLGCPFCPYTDGNSQIRKFYHEKGGDLFPPSLFRKIADESAPYKAFLRCTGGGEPLLHPQMVDLIEYSKKVGARIWLNTNGTLLGPHHAKTKQSLERLIECDTDLMEFSVDAGDSDTYNIVRPPRRGPGDPIRWERLVRAVRHALQHRKRTRSKTRIVCSIIMDTIIGDKASAAVRFWLDDVGVDEVITRKYLTWDNNTNLKLDKAMDPMLYALTEEKDTAKLAPCVWPFERMNVDTLGRVALCGQDISFGTSEQFPNVNDQSIRDIWQGETFNKYRRMHLSHQGGRILPCSNCSAWKAGVRDWQHGWLKVLNTAEKHRTDGLTHADVADIGVTTEIRSRDV